jgi:hypothetical protein
MTAINSLTHMRSIHANVEDSSKHIKTNIFETLSRKVPDIIHKVLL